MGRSVVVSYRLHEKPGKPTPVRAPIVRHAWHREWVCFEHGGLAAPARRAVVAEAGAGMRCRTRSLKRCRNEAGLAEPTKILIRP